jgi:hypothetical protein
LQRRHMPDRKLFLFNAQQEHLVGSEGLDLIVSIVHWFAIRRIEISFFRYLQKLANQPSSDPLNEVVHFLKTLKILMFETEECNKVPGVSRMVRRVDVSLA